MSSTLENADWTNSTIIRVDEYRLMVYPVVLGGGKRLFGEGLPMTGFSIVESQPTGAVLNLRLQPLLS